ncbi:hypothetical protein SAMN02800691_3575 [Luteibacter sp. UNCMF366Tsu5.1]|nr:hypothetical protein [Luteibacter sp. UNCMF366Tsu5.1]SFW75699.1 hypothetical protein SAMN02800691_3575 [Luteibacter sp. UNCMF366Tsu5.1]
MNDVRNASEHLLMLTAQVEDLLVDIRKETKESERILRATREREVATFREQMASILEHHDTRIDDALRPRVVRAWQFVMIVSVLGIVLLGAAVWLSAHYMRVIEQNQLSADLLKAYNRADVTLCDGRLCARVDTKGKRWGEKGEYMPVQPR